MLFFVQKMEKSEFLSFFYKHSMHVMTAPLFATTCDDKPSKGKLLLLFHRVHYLLVVFVLASREPEFLHDNVSVFFMVYIFA